MDDPALTEVNELTERLMEQKAGYELRIRNLNVLLPRAVRSVKIRPGATEKLHVQIDILTIFAAELGVTIQDLRRIGERLETD